LRNIFLTLLLSSISFAQLAEKDKAELAFKNIVKNPGFENGVSSWVKTGSATLSASTSTPALGNGKAIVDFSASSEYMRSAAATVPAGLYGKNCLAKFKYNGGGTADIYYRVTDGTNTIAGYTATSTSYNITSAVSTWTDSLDLTFPCPTSGSLKLELESAGNAAALSIDDVYIGENFRLGNVAQAELVGTLTYAAASNCVWIKNSTMANFSADTDCSTPTVTGGLSAPGTKIPAFVMSNVKPGNYFIRARAVYFAESTTDCLWRIYDGTNEVSKKYNMYDGARFNDVIGQITYTTPQTNVTFNIQAAVIAGPNNCRIDASSAQSSDLFFEVYRYPLTSETVVSANIPYQGGTLTYPNTTNCQWSTTSASPTFAGFSADTDCGTQSVNGNVSATATKIPGFLVNSLEAGKYMVIAQGQLFANSGDCEYRLHDGTSASGYAATY
jgi:hypothetical protein